MLLAIDRAGNIIGHTILRQQSDTDLGTYGLVSTTHVAPESRRLGIAHELLNAGEAWFRDLGLSLYATATSSTNERLTRLYQKHGFEITAQQRDETTGTLMVRLTKRAPCNEAEIYFSQIFDGLDTD